MRAEAEARQGRRVAGSANVLFGPTRFACRPDAPLISLRRPPAVLGEHRSLFALQARLVVLLVASAARRGHRAQRRCHRGVPPRVPDRADGVACAAKSRGHRVTRAAGHSKAHSGSWAPHRPDPASAAGVRSIFIRQVVCRPIEAIAGRGRRVVGVLDRSGPRPWPVRHLQL